MSVVRERTSEENLERVNEGDRAAGRWGTAAMDYSRPVLVSVSTATGHGQVYMRGTCLRALVPS